MDNSKASLGRMVAVGELAAALGTTRNTLIRWIAKGRIPEPMRAPADLVIPSGSDHVVGGSWRKWQLATAVEIVRAAGRPIPKEWV